MKNNVLIALIIGSLGNRIHAMEQSLLEQLQKDADQLIVEAMELMDDINRHGDQERAELMEVVAGRIDGQNQALAPNPNADNQGDQPQEPIASDGDINICWRELWKKIGALEHLSKLNIFPTEGTQATMQASFNQLNEAYNYHLDIQKRTPVALFLADIAEAAAQNNQN